MKAVNLAAVRVPLHDGVEEPKRILGGIPHLAGEEDEAGAGGEDGFAVGGMLQDGGGEIAEFEELEKRCGLTAGNDEVRAVGEVVGCSDLAGGRSNAREDACMSMEGSLKGEKSDRRCIRGKGI